MRKKFDDDFLPFRDVINEYYAKDISKKIKSTFKAKGESGKHVASSPPYGYLKDSGYKNKWVIDEEAAPIVRRIFRMTLEGYGPYQVATQLSDEHIPVPAYHQAQLGVGLWQNREIKYPYKWTSYTIAHILQKHEYLGHTVNFKTRKHFKDKKSHYVDKDQWLIFEETHEPIIDQETIVNYNAEEQTATVYTRDKAVMQKLDTLVADFPDTYRLTEQDEVSKTYSFPKSYVSYRKPRAVSTEQREQARQMIIAQNKAKEV